MPKPNKKPAPTREPRNPRRGFKPVMVRLEPAQIEALRAEAIRRMEDRGGAQLDMSQIVREAVAAWLAKRR